MSQEKVERYKQYKANRKEILAKEKRKKKLTRIACWVALVLVVGGTAGGIGYSYYARYQAELASRPTYTTTSYEISDLAGVLTTEAETTAE